MLLRVFVDFVVSRHKVFVRFRLCPLSTHDEGGDIGGEAGQASGEPRDILRDVDDVTIMRILPSLEVLTFQNPIVRSRWAHTSYTRHKYCCTSAVTLAQVVLGYGSNACLHHSKNTYTCTCVPRASQNSHVESGIRALRIRVPLLQAHGTAEVPHRP